jgi:predicted GNAT superfamily acetyltransferase
MSAPALEARPASGADFPAILALNEESVAVLSPLSAECLAQLHGQAAVHWVAERRGHVVAFLLALREGADYASPNYRWFAERYARFLYVDRVVVSVNAHGQGVGSLLYRRLFEHAAATQAERVVCEFDIEPPNPESEAFHARFGFREVGRQRVAGGRKLVSLQAVEVAPAVSR